MDHFSTISIYEIIERLCTSLSFQDILNLRSTCKYTCSFITEVMARRMKMSIDMDPKYLILSYSTDKLYDRMDTYLTSCLRYIASTGIKVENLRSNVCRDIANAFIQVLKSNPHTVGTLTGWISDNIDLVEENILAKVFALSRNVELCFKVVDMLDNKNDRLVKYIFEYLGVYYLHSVKENGMVTIIDRTIGHSTWIESKYIKYMLKGMIHLSEDTSLPMKLVNDFREIMSDKIIDTYVATMLVTIISLTFTKTNSATEFSPYFDISKMSSHVRDIWYEKGIKMAMKATVKMHNFKCKIGNLLKSLMLQGDIASFETSYDVIVTICDWDDTTITSILQDTFENMDDSHIGYMRIVVKKMIYSGREIGLLCLKNWVMLTRANFITSRSTGNKSPRYYLHSILYNEVVKEGKLVGSTYDCVSRFMVDLSSKINPEDAYSIGLKASEVLCKRIITQSQSIKVLTNLVQGLRESSSIFSNEIIGKIEGKISMLEKRRMKNRRNN